MVSGLLARCIMYVWKLNSLKENKEKFFCHSVTIGTLYPAYRSYKSLINSDLREVVKRDYFVFCFPK